MTICVLAGHASARPGVDIHSVGGDSASDASVVDDMERGAAVGGDSASDSSVVDDTERSAAAVAGESEGSGIDLCVVFVTLHHDNDGKPGKTPSRCADEGESGSGADDISRRAAACKREVPGGSVASAARCDGDGGSDPFTGDQAMVSPSAGRSISVIADSTAALSRLPLASCAAEKILGIVGGTSEL